MALEGEDQRINANTSVVADPRTRDSFAIAVAVPPAVPRASGLEVLPLLDGLLRHVLDKTVGVLTGQREERTHADNNRKELQE
eukprot:9535448-Alexandrium_andersonii.AAC.1